MKLLAFKSKNTFGQTYSSLLNKYKTYKGIVDLIKIGVILVSVIFFSFVYLYFINESSTQGYFLRQATNDLNTIKFQYEVIKTSVLGYRQQNWEQMHNAFGTTDRVINIHSTIVANSQNKDLSLR